MKKILIIINLFLILCGCFISCGNNENPKSNELYESITSQIEIYDFDVEHFANDKIDLVKTNIKYSGIEIKGNLYQVSRYSKESEFGEITYVYVYEFELESDAQRFNQEYPQNYNPKEFYSKRKNNIVVFGNFEEIKNLSF